MKKKNWTTGTNVKSTHHELAQMFRSLFTAKLSQSTKTTKNTIQNVRVRNWKNSLDAALSWAWTAAKASEWALK